MTAPPGWRVLPRDRPAPAGLVLPVGNGEGVTTYAHSSGACAVEIDPEDLPEGSEALAVTQPLLILSNLSTLSARDAAAAFIISKLPSHTIALQPEDTRRMTATLSGKGYTCRVEGPGAIRRAGRTAARLDIVTVEPSAEPPGASITPLRNKFPEPAGNLHRRAGWFRKQHGDD